MDIYKRFCDETQTKPKPEDFFKAFVMESTGRLEDTLDKLIGYTRMPASVSLRYPVAYYWANSLKKYPLITKHKLTFGEREFPKGTECERIHGFYVIKGVLTPFSGYYHVDREDLEII